MDKDPREVTDEQDSELERLTDEEDEENVEEPDESLVKELERQLLETTRKQEDLRRRLEELKRRKKANKRIEAQPLPSPSREDGNEVKNVSRNLTDALQSERSTLDDSNEERKPSVPYFLQKLEETRKKEIDNREQKKTMFKSRIYTFDSIMDSQPVDVDEKEYFSGQLIKRRYVDQQQLTEFFKDKKVMRLPKLYAKVSPPDFEEPKYPNWLVIGIISEKGRPKVTSNGRGRFMTITLTDFNLSVSVSFFNTTVEKYDRLRIGDVIAILNPDIYIKSDYTANGVKTFGLSIRHTGDSVLEIGKSRDFGFCPALRRDGTVCGTPINKSLQSSCLYHEELRLRRTAGKRMEFQTTVGQRSPSKGGRKQHMMVSNNKIVKVFDANQQQQGPTHVEKAKKFFSSTNKHEKFFNSEISDFGDIKRKQIRQEKYRSLRKDIDLQQKLKESLEGGKNLKKYHSIHGEPEDSETSLEEKKALLKYAYGGKGLSKLGFDPTAKGASKGLLSKIDDDQRAQATSTLDELRDITKNKKANFSLWKEEVARRRKMKHETDKMLEKMKEHTPSPSAETSTNESASTRMITLDDSESDSDSDGYHPPTKKPNTTR
ncbi:Minichromosome maintenance protein 10 AltName: Full=Protein DNA43 [Cyberlindnera jadinii]|uniref:Uncharacterized protein n=1 Tax=Cyberlindnera jadinii (strain ATCC 18201 / CBS 1600 / BCRC 20928 / JCM 3617 / NBRC 0987 / NRRL Y-1542) TaxID=983966 RepID=A0A0H5CAA0_CYBJN|nr:Minichromosome maintenance protein 10 AltName: Full=Protein DNA43 [Cyberlindnera jadinii]